LCGILSPFGKEGRTKGRIKISRQAPKRQRGRAWHSVTRVGVRDRSWLREALLFSVSSSAPFSLSLRVCVCVTFQMGLFFHVDCNWLRLCLLGEFTFLEYLNWIEWRKKMSRLTGGHLVVACLLLCDSFLFSFSPHHHHHMTRITQKNRGVERRSTITIIFVSPFFHRGVVFLTFSLFFKKISGENVCV
jgi:hypothetical protein